jgi:hypothetical protein
MKRIVATFAFVFLMGVLSSCARQDLPEDRLETTAASWSNLGGKVSTFEDEIIPALAFNASGDPIVVTRSTRDIHANYRVYVKQWVNGAWSVLGSFVNIDGNQTASVPSLAIDKLGRPVVAWTETNAQGNNHLYVKRWNGQRWVLLGGRLNVKAAVSPKIAIDGQNRPVVAWTEYSPNLPVDNWNLSVKRWENDSSWVQLGGILDNVERNTAGNMSIVIDKVGRPIVTWVEINVNSYSNVYVKRWNGVRWVSLGESLGSGWGFAPSIALSSSGKLFVAVQEAWNRSVVKRWDGNGTWTSLLAPRDTNSTSRVFLTSDGDTPILAWSIGNQAYVKRWNGVDKWVNVGRQPVLTESLITDLKMSPTGVLTLAYHYQPTDPNNFDDWGPYIKQYK